MDNVSISMGKRQLVDSIWKSAGIEGLGTTFPDTECILENIPVKTTQEEVFFIVNLKRAWQFLFDNIEYPNNLMFLRELNKIAMQNLSYIPGEIRKQPVSIGGTSWVPDMPREGVVMSELERVNDMNDKLECALEMFCYISRSQIFLDGNKRTAQLMANKVLMENDIGILSVPYDEIPKFKGLLVQFYESNDASDIKGFFREKCLLLNPDYAAGQVIPDSETGKDGEDDYLEAKECEEDLG